MAAEFKTGSFLQCLKLEINFEKSVILRENKEYNL